MSHYLHILDMDWTYHPPLRGSGWFRWFVRFSWREWGLGVRWRGQYPARWADGVTGNSWDAELAIGPVAFVMDYGWSHRADGAA